MNRNDKGVRQHKTERTMPPQSLSLLFPKSTSRKTRGTNWSI
jgi:hypothetical protein